jgi:HAMP domain-containing protein
VAFPDAPRSGYAVVVDLQVNDAIRKQLRRETGVELKSVSAVPPKKATDARPLGGSDGGDADALAPPAPPGALSKLTTLMDYRDWSTGETGALTASIALSVSELYDQISPAQGSVGRTFSQGLLLVLFVIGALFLIIEAMALVAGFALAKSLTGSVHALFTGTERVRQGDFTHKIAVRSEDQLGELALSFNSMTAEHRGSAAPGGREEAARRGAAHRPRDPDVAAAAGPAGDGRAVGDRALRAGARSRRRLLRLPAARRPSRRRPDRRRSGKGTSRPSTWRS